MIDEDKVVFGRAASGSLKSGGQESVVERGMSVDQQQRLPCSV